jgi:hypothetical protein
MSVDDSLAPRSTTSVPVSWFCRLQDWLGARCLAVRGAPRLDANGVLANGVSESPKVERSESFGERSEP